VGGWEAGKRGEVCFAEGAEKEKDGDEEN